MKINAETAAPRASGPEGLLSDATGRFYRLSASALTEAGVPFLVGGAFALAQYTAVERNTKDLDLFVRPADAHRALDALQRAGFRTHLTFPHWLGKAHSGESFVDIIFSSGNGVAIVDDQWFSNARMASVLGIPLAVCPPEEMIWSKAFILERERFDGADIIHLLRDCAEVLDWRRLLIRFGEHWRVLLAHLVLFGYVYPGERERVPSWLMGEMLQRMNVEGADSPCDERVCQGTLLSREQYLVDIERLGYQDARVARPEVQMTREDIAIWTDAIPDRSPEVAKSKHQRRRGR